jgi:hypothetical protein
VTGGALATQVAGVVLAAWLFKRLFTTRWLPAFALGGLVAVATGGAMLQAVRPGNAVAVVAGTGLLLGFGAGAGVSPGLFMAGLSAPSSRLGPTFALVELLRSEAAFLIAPVVLQVVLALGDPAGGTRLLALALLAFCVAGGLGLVVVYALGGVRPHAPDLDRWVEGEQPAYHSPPVAAAIRGDGGP